MVGSVVGVAEGATVVETAVKVGGGGNVAGRVAVAGMTVAVAGIAVGDGRVTEIVVAGLQPTTRLTRKKQLAK